MKKYKRKPWTEAERKVLTTNYYHMDIDILAEILEDRTATAIRSQVWYLKKRGVRFAQ